MHMCYERPGLITALNGGTGYDKWERSGGGGSGGGPGGSWAGRDRERDRERERQARAHQMSHAHAAEPDASSLFPAPFRVTGKSDIVSQQIRTKLGDYNIAQTLLDDPSKSIGICAEPPSPAPCHPSRRESEFKKPAHAPQNGRVHRPYMYNKSEAPGSTGAPPHRPPNLRIPNGFQTQNAIDSSQPPIESILKEMKSLPTPLSVIAATPRKELENKFTFNPFTNRLMQETPATTSDLKSSPLPKPGLDNRISNSSRSSVSPDVVKNDLGLSESDDEVAATTTRLEPILSPIGSGGTASSSESSPSDSESESSSAESSPAAAPPPPPAPAPPPARLSSWCLSNFAPQLASVNPPDNSYESKELRHALADVKGKPSPLSDMSDSSASSGSPRARRAAARSSALSSDDDNTDHSHHNTTSPRLSANAVNVSAPLKRGRPPKKSTTEPPKKKRGRPPKLRPSPAVAEADSDKEPEPMPPQPAHPALHDTKTHIFRKVFTPKKGDEGGGKGGKGGKGKGGKGKAQVTVIEVTAPDAGSDHERRREEALARVSPQPEPDTRRERNERSERSERKCLHPPAQRSDRSERIHTERTSNDRMQAERAERTERNAAPDRAAADRLSSLPPDRLAPDRLTTDRLMADRLTSPAGRLTSPAARLTSPAARLTSPAARLTSPASRLTSPAGRHPDRIPHPPERIPSERHSKDDRVSSDRIGSDRVSSDRVGSDRVSSDRIGSDRVSSDRVGSDRVTSDRVGSDRVSSDRVGSDRVSSDRVGSDRVSSDRIGSDRLSSDRIGSDRLAPDRFASERVSSERLSGEKTPLDKLAIERLSDKLSVERYVKAEADVGSGLKSGRGSERLEEASSNVSGRAERVAEGAEGAGGAARSSRRRGGGGRLVVRVALSRLRAELVRSLARPPAARAPDRPAVQASEVAGTNHERTEAGRTPIYYSYFERLPADALSDEERDHKYYLGEACRLRSAAEREQQPLPRVMLYLESVLCFVLTGRVLELELDTKRAFTIYRETIEYIKSIHSMPQRFRASPHSPHSTFSKLDILSLRVQALLYLRMFKMYNREVKEYYKIVQEYQQKPACAESVSPLSPTPSPAGSLGSVGSVGSAGSASSGSGSASSGYCSLAHSVPAHAHHALLQLTKYYTFLYVAHELWEQADCLCRLRPNQDLFIAVDRKCGPLTLFSTFRHLVQYVRHAISLLKAAPRE